MQQHDRRIASGAIRTRVELDDMQPAAVDVHEAAGRRMVARNLPGAERRDHGERCEKRESDDDEGRDHTQRASLTLSPSHGRAGLMTAVIHP
jgi:hypothetical protein